MTTNGKNILIRSLDDISGKILFLERNTPSFNITGKRGMEKTTSTRGYPVAEHLQQAVIITHSACSPRTQGMIINNPENLLNINDFITLADFSEAPQLEMVDLGQYNGMPGCTIRIKAANVYRVSEIWVSISSMDGSCSESGMARADDDCGEWVYTSSETIGFSGRSIHISLSDIPGYLNRTYQYIKAN